MRNLTEIENKLYSDLVASKSNVFSQEFYGWHDTLNEKHVAVYELRKRGCKTYIHVCIDTTYLLVKDTDYTAVAEELKKLENVKELKARGNQRVFTFKCTLAQLNKTKLVKAVQDIQNAKKDAMKKADAVVEAEKKTAKKTASKKTATAKKTATKTASKTAKKAVKTESEKTA